ncbi:hypothetical protein CCACVL1_24659 [Corchorus capsularis]|uniref:Uncharacterized protein n=1 Tax=Corchorus capsularis TaxID=210143 RepID=A0A1R3GNK4_COCAP|nr:hypothetical protein CCACVL1_24659 [Corchorus capsularis]
MDKFINDLRYGSNLQMKVVRRHHLRGQNL